MSDLRAETLKMIRAQLAVRFPDEQPGSLDQFAEGLQAVAIEYDVPIIEELFRWIHQRYESKEWTLGEWRDYCAHYRILRELAE